MFLIVCFEVSNTILSDCLFPYYFTYSFLSLLDAFYWISFVKSLLDLAFLSSFFINFSNRRKLQFWIGNFWHFVLVKIRNHLLRSLKIVQWVSNYILHTHIRIRNWWFDWFDVSQVVFLPWTEVLFTPNDWHYFRLGRIRIVKVLRLLCFFLSWS